MKGVGEEGWRVTDEVVVDASSSLSTKLGGIAPRVAGLAGQPFSAFYFGRGSPGTHFAVQYSIAPGSLLGAALVKVSAELQ